MEGNKKKLTISEYRRLFDSLYPQLCVYAYKYLDNLELSKDMVQEIFIKVWEDKIPFVDDSHSTGYFYKAVKNKCLNHLKSKHYKITERYELAELEDYDTEEFVFTEDVSIETSEIINRAIDELPTKAGEVIRLSIKDYTNNEIAEKLSISVNTVKDHKKVAYRKLRLALGFLTTTPANC